MNSAIDLVKNAPQLPLWVELVKSALPLVAALIAVCGVIYTVSKNYEKALKIEDDKEIRARLNIIQVLHSELDIYCRTIKTHLPVVEIMRNLSNMKKHLEGKEDSSFKPWGELD